MVISGPGNAKTETVQSVSAIDGAVVVSTITSEGALLSATPQKSRSKGATGGLLRRIGKRGLLVIKDFTSILSAGRELRAAMLAALREVHDGKWVRNVGTDGGQTLIWEGRIVVIGACTTAWDQAHAVISIMGDRFVLVRSDSYTGRLAAGEHAIRNTGREPAMRQEMANVVAGLIATVADRDYPLAEDDATRILAAADLVTLARTGVRLDYRGDVIDAHAPEMPTRFAKQLTQIMRGGRAIGMGQTEALALALRCARDLMPELRLAVLEDLAANGELRVTDIRRRLQKPRATSDRVLQAPALPPAAGLPGGAGRAEREKGPGPRLFPGARNRPQGAPSITRRATAPLTTIPVSSVEVCRCVEMRQREPLFLLLTFLASPEPPGPSKGENDDARKIMHARPRHQVRLGRSPSLTGHRAPATTREPSPISSLRPSP